MKDPKVRQRLIWIGVVAGVMVIALIFVSMAAPSRPGNTDPVLDIPEEQTAGATAPLGVAPEGDDESSSSGFSLGRGGAFSLAWRLGLVAVIIGVSIAALRWWGKKASAPRSATGFIRIVDTLGISNGRTIHLLALGDRVIVVGATPQQLTYLSELAAEDAERVLTESPKPGDVPLAHFATELFQSMRRTGERGGDQQTRPSVIGAEDLPSVVRPERPRL